MSLLGCSTVSLIGRRTTENSNSILHSKIHTRHPLKSGVIHSLTGLSETGPDSSSSTRASVSKWPLRRASRPMPSASAAWSETRARGARGVGGWCRCLDRLEDGILSIILSLLKGSRQSGLIRCFFAQGLGLFDGVCRSLTAF